MGWRNWSGSVAASAAVVQPQSEDELASLVRAAPKVRATGAGHSFMPLCETDGLLINLDALAGDIAIADDRCSARIPGGWSIKRVSAALWRAGLALANQGDVNPQSIAGALATGTHGTGTAFGSLATFARGFRLVGADGAVRWCDAHTNSDLYQAQRLSLGLFGVATEIEVAVVPAFYLTERIEKRRWDDLRESYDDLASRHRHIEFWLFPYSDHAIVKTLDATEPCDPPPSTTDMDETAFRRILNVSARLPWLTPTLQRAMMRSNMKGRRRGPAHSIFPSERTIKFEEMEYELPRAAGLDTLADLVGWIRKKRLPVTFPFEYRTVAADDIWISPMNAGPVAAISMHQYAKMPWRDLFADAEQVFRAAGGRPHWAKRHLLNRADVDRLYPMAEQFRAVRRIADPAGKFLNRHLEELFS